MGIMSRKDAIRLGVNPRQFEYRTFTIRKRQGQHGTGILAKRKEWYAAQSRAGSVFLAGVKLVSSANAREHWSVRQKRALTQRSDAWAAAVNILGSRRTDPISRTVTITRYGPMELDGDNLAISAKHIRDGIADALGVNDNDPRITWTVLQEQSPRGCYGVRIEIQEA